MSELRAPALIMPTPRCPECGYLRKGLASAHVCPECGWKPREDEIILWGFGHGRHATAHNSPARGLVGVLLVTNAGMLLPLVQAFIFGYTWAWCAVAFAVGLNVWVLARRRARIRELGTPEQARFTPEGCGQRTGVGPVTIRPWNNVKQIVVGQGFTGLIMRCEPGFLSPGSPVEILIPDGSVDRYAVQEQLEAWWAARGDPSAA